MRTDNENEEIYLMAARFGAPQAVTARQLIRNNMNVVIVNLIIQNLCRFPKYTINSILGIGVRHILGINKSAEMVRSSGISVQKVKQKTYSG